MGMLKIEMWDRPIGYVTGTIRIMPKNKYFATINIDGEITCEDKFMMDKKTIEIWNKIKEI